MESQAIVDPKYISNGGILLRKNKITIPKVPKLRELILQWLHSSHQGGHLGIKATHQRIKQLFYWKGLLRDIEQYIQNCETCLWCKCETMVAPNLLWPLPIHEGVWYSTVMDFIDGLPKSNGKDTI